MEYEITGKEITGIYFKTFDNNIMYLESVLIKCGEESFLLSAQQDDDTIKLTQVKPDFGKKEYQNIIKLQHPLKDVIGNTVVWSWLLKNNQGYIDGFQIAIRGIGEFQFMVEASFIRISKLTRIKF